MFPHFGCVIIHLNPLLLIKKGKWERQILINKRNNKTKETIKETNQDYSNNRLRSRRRLKGCLVNQINDLIN